MPARCAALRAACSFRKKKLTRVVPNLKPRSHSCAASHAPREATPASNLVGTLLRLLIVYTLNREQFV
ncbi:hypothetical protein J6590_014048 [Homalodisca vitripennis]|nr:hypothetical protein J6590_014048 [Homalodisca vitripennis]